MSEEDRSACAGFFRTVQVDPQTQVAALFVIDGRGEPLEFTYNRASVKHRRLWRESDLHHAMTRELLRSVLDACPRDLTLLLLPASEIGPDLVAEEIAVERPVARVAMDSEEIHVGANEEHERLANSGTQVAWAGEPPAASTLARRLTERLAPRDLLLEPFHRLRVGLEEAYELPPAEDVAENESTLEPSRASSPLDTTH